MKFAVAIEYCDGVPTCYLAPWSGDPGRTRVIESARRYSSERGARIALGLARRISPFKNAKVIEVES